MSTRSLTEEERAELWRLEELRDAEEEAEQRRRAEELGRRIEEARAFQEATANARRELFERCIGDSERTVFMTGYEDISVAGETIRHLLSCVDRLEKRIAELEAPSP